MAKRFQSLAVQGRIRSANRPPNVSASVNGDKREISTKRAGHAPCVVTARCAAGTIAVDDERPKLKSDAVDARVTAVLLNWRRPDNFSRILPNLLTHDFIDEILVWNNATVPLDVSALLDHPRSSRVRVIDSPQNACTYGRFCAVREAGREIIFTQDDDCLIHNVRELYERFRSHRCGITAGLSPAHYRAEANRTPWLQLGWGSFFLKSWVDVLDRWIERYGRDELLHRKADRIFTILFGEHDPRQGQFETLPGPDGRPSDRDKHSLWLRSDHSRLTALAARRTLLLKRRLTKSTATESH